MKLIVLGSSSKGNGYLLTNGDETLIMEAGVSFKNVKKQLDFNLRSIQGAIVTHSHNDHSGFIKQYAQAGIDILAGPDVLSKHQIRGKALNGMARYQIGGFTVISFPVEHDVPCYGFYINHPETGGMIFVTDTYLCKYTFPGLNHLIVEANYAEDIARNNLETGVINRYVWNRLWHSHMELETTKGLILANNPDKTVRDITLIHLSDKNSDEKRFVREVSELTGIPTYAAYPGFVLPLNI